MTDEQIIELAKQLGFQRMRIDHDYYVCFSKEIVEFSKLVAQHERGTVEDRIVDLFAEMENPYLPDIVRAIGARGEA